MEGNDKRQWKAPEATSGARYFFIVLKMSTALAFMLHTNEFYTQTFKLNRQTGIFFKSLPNMSKFMYAFMFSALVLLITRDLRG